MADIKFLKLSLPSAEQVLKIKPQLDALYEKKKMYSEELTVLKEEIEGKEKEIEGVRKEIEEAKEQRQDIKQQLDKFEADIVKIKEDLEKLYAQKNTVKEEYYKNKLEFETEKDEIYNLEWMAKEKQRILDFETEKVRRIEVRKQALLDRPNPYQKEMDTCERLIGYCNGMKVKYGLAESPEDQVIKEEQKQLSN